MPNKPQLNSDYCGFCLRLGGSSIHRWGVFAQERIPKGRKVIEYTGERVSRREAKRRSDTAEHVYLFTIDNYWSKDGAVGGSGAEYINHSCHPNIRVVVTKGHILYYSCREIRRGEELTVDYNFGKNVEKHFCRCGAANCRGTMNRK